MTDPRRIFALIVGINQYKYPHPQELPNLNGAVNDANHMRRILRNTIGVPAQNICLLVDHQATRDAILASFENFLIQNPSIRKDDAIVVFFAGHGTRVAAPSGWATNDMQIEGLCAHDTLCRAYGGQNIERGYVIPDRTINYLLRRLAYKKGNNIVVIFDCCHSGGMARGSPDDGRDPPRFCTNPLPIPSDLDENLWGTEPADSRKGYKENFFGLYKSWESHVLLAACRDNEIAESILCNSEVRGIFTYFLLDGLQTMFNQGIRLTYAQLLENLPTQLKPKLRKGIVQTPQCEGVHRDRYIFSTQFLPRNPREFSIFFEGPIAKVATGHAHGVEPGTEFQLTSPYSNTEIGITVAQSVDTDTAVLVWPPPRSSVSITTPVKAIMLSRMAVFAQQNLGSYLTYSHFFQLVPSPSHADLSLKIGPKRNTVIFERLDPLISKHAKREITRFVDIHHLSPILNSISHFNYHLGRTVKASSFLKKVGSWGDLINKVQMRLLPLGPSDSWGDRALDPRYGDLFNGYKAVLTENRDQYYGLEILNHSNKDLFVYLFSFDPSDYSIENWYKPLAPTMAAPLKAIVNRKPGMISIGYGAGGGDPINFSVGGNESSDTTFLKLFVSERYIDMEYLKQDPVFGSGEPRPKAYNINNGEWATLLASVTVRKGTNYVQ